VKIEPTEVHGPQVLVPGEAEDEVLGVPARIAAHVEDGSLPWDVSFTLTLDDDLVPVIDEVTLRRRAGGLPVTPSAIRGISLTRLRDEAVSRAANRFRRIERQDGSQMLTLVLEETRENLGRKSRATLEKRPPSGKPRRNAPSEETLLEAMRLYRIAKRRKVADPLRHVAGEMGYARATVHKYVQRAQELGL